MLPEIMPAPLYITQLQGFSVSALAAIAEAGEKVGGSSVDD